MKAPRTYPAVVIANKSRIPVTDEGTEVREVIIEIDEPGFTCEAGQSIGVLAPVPEGVDEPYHLRWYSIADVPARDDRGRLNVTICVRRIVAKDPDTGKDVRGLSSNYLCDLQPGSALDVAGPYGLPFPLPAEADATLILIGTGTGIAPFRSFVKTLYRSNPDWMGTIHLFYGTRNGLDVLYVNDPQGDVMQYFDKETFEAFKAFCPPPHWADPITWDLAYSERGNELLALMDKPNTYVYVAGLKTIGEHLDTLFSKLLGSKNLWALKKGELQAAKRWAELLY